MRGGGIDNFSNRARVIDLSRYRYPESERYAYLSVTDAFSSGKVIADTELPGCFLRRLLATSLKHKTRFINDGYYVRRGKSVSECFSTRKIKRARFSEIFQKASRPCELNDVTLQGRAPQTEFRALFTREHPRNFDRVDKRRSPNVARCVELRVGLGLKFSREL